MIVLFAYVSLALIQLYKQYQRRKQYSAAMFKALRSGSILVQRGKGAQHGSVGALLNSSLLTCSRSYKETLLLADEHLAVSSVSPKQQVDLGEWCSYLDLQPPQSSGSSGVVVLLEAGPSDSTSTSTSSSTSTPQQLSLLASKVQVLKHGCPLAWKYGNPFGIIMHCTLEDFVALCDGLGQGQLTLNEDMQLYRLLTISTVGKAKSLRRPASEVIPSPADTSSSPGKTRRANTDPVPLSAHPAPSPDRQQTAAGGEDMKAKATDASAVMPKAQDSSVDKAEGGYSVSEKSVTQKVAERNLKARVADVSATVPKADLDGSVVKYAEGLVTENSVAQRAGSVITSEASENKMSADAQQSTNGDDALVAEKHAVVEESPVVCFNSSVVHSQENKAPTLSASADVQSLSDGHQSVSLGADNENRSVDANEKKIPEDDGIMTLGSGSSSSSGKHNAPTADVNNGGDGSPSMAVSAKDGIITQKEQNAKVTATSEIEKDGSVLQKNDLSAPESVSAKQDVKKRDNVNSAGSGDSSKQQPPEKKASANGSAHVLNESSKAEGVETTAAVAVATKIKGSESSPQAAENNVSPKSMSDSRNGAEGKGTQQQSAENASPKNGTVGAAAAANGDDNKGGQSKPPNIVVYCGKKDFARRYEQIRQGLEHCLNTSAYTIYPLPHEEVMTLPWEDNSACLVVSYDYLHDNICKKFTNYLLKGGKVLSFSSSLEAEFLVRKEVKGRAGVTTFTLQKWRDVSTGLGRYHYVAGSLKRGNSSMDTLVVDPSTSLPLVVRVTLSSENGNGKAIFSQLLLERDPSEMASDSKMFSRLKQSSQQRCEVLRHLLSLLDLDTSTTPQLPLTPCYLLTQDQALQKSFLDSISGRMKQDVIRSRSLSLKFVSSSKSATSGSALTATQDTLPVVTHTTPASFTALKDKGHLQLFDPELYWSSLTSRVLGHVVMYTEVIPTLMTLFEGIQFSLPDDLGVIAVAGRQTSGKGRGGNQWLSPAGCAMYCLPLQFPTDSELGQRVTYLQHMAALSIVEAIRSLPGYQDLDLRLKWPNDIYYGSKVKLGGVLVNCSAMGKSMHATVGCGVNVSNTRPTVCINSVIADHNRLTGANLKPLSTSQVVARAVSVLESLVSQFQQKGHQDFCQQYYKHWLHSGARVSVESEGGMEVEVEGLDDYGFLRVVNKQGQHFSLQPDGNSFDMMKNLISIKRA